MRQVNTVLILVMALVCASCIRLPARDPPGLSETEKRLRAEEFEHFEIGKTTVLEVQNVLGAPTWWSDNQEACMYRWDREYTDILLTDYGGFSKKTIKYHLLLLKFDSAKTLIRYEHRRFSNMAEAMIGPTAVEEWAAQARD